MTTERITDRLTRLEQRLEALVEQLNSLPASQVEDEKIAESVREIVTESEQVKQEVEAAAPEPEAEVPVEVPVEVPAEGGGEVIGPVEHPVPVVVPPAPAPVEHPAPVVVPPAPAPRKKKKHSAEEIHEAPQVASSSMASASSSTVQPISLLQLLNQSTQTDLTKTESRIVTAYLVHISSMLSNVELPSGGASGCPGPVDYHIIGWTLEFVLTAQNDIVKLINKEAMNDLVIVNACIFLLQQYVQKANMPVALPTNLEGLLRYSLDILKGRYHLVNYTAIKAANKDKRRVSNAIRWSTIKKRWTRRSDSSCLPTTDINAD